MSDYFDHYFDAAEAGVFMVLLATEANILGPRSGIPAFIPAEGALDDISGEPLLPQPARGDPARLYIAVRSASEIPVPEGAVATAPTLAQAILGVWA